MTPSPDGVNVPAEDVVRQAINAIRGFAYQLYATALAWTRLGANETLLVEVADDYSVLAEDALRLVPVKDNAASGSVTLRSKGVVDALNSFWRFKHNNPTLHVTLAYLTTASPGFEADVTFPGGVQGLVFWRVAAREGADIKALRALLTQLPLEAGLLDWIQQSDDETVRRDLLRRVRWECGAPSIQELDHLLPDALIRATPRLSLAPSDAKRAVPAVLYHLLKLASTKGERKATQPDLIDIVEGATSVSIAMSALRRLVANQSDTPTSEDFVLTALETVPTLTAAVSRPALVEGLQSILRRGSTPWLVGSSGSGKTALALETARTSNRGWWVLQLRGYDNRTVAARLRAARRIVADSNFGGLLLDDFPAGAHGEAKFELACLGYAINATDGALIVTSYESPAPTLRQAFSSEVETFDELYFSEEEVGALITANGGDAAMWARPTYQFSSRGHPQLVAARVIGLNSRGWPEHELLGGAPLHPSPDADQERDAIRKRLLAELPDAPRQLLYRLTLTAVSFDRALALSIGAAEPTIGTPGEALDVLIGPWIEMYTANELRVSPLVSDAGDKMLSAEEKIAVHRAICGNLSKRRPFPAERLPQLLISGLAARDKDALTIVTMAPFAASAEHWAPIAHELFVMRYFKTDSRIFGEDSRISAMLRLTQLRVILATNNDDSAKAVYDRLQIETDGLEGRENILTAAAFSMLSQSKSPLAPQEWFPIARSLEHHKLTESFGGPEDSAGAPAWHPAEAMFVWRATQLRDVADLQALFSVLDEADVDTRQRYLSALAEPYAGRRAVVQTAWSREASKPGFDGRAALAALDPLASMVSQWAEHGFAIEIECARAVLLAEYCDDCDAALAVLATAETRWPNEPRLARERTKIEFRLGKHRDVLDGLEGLVSRIPSADAVERVMALREAAMSAARLGEYRRAAHLFAEARTACATSLGKMPETSIGLTADRAIMLFEIGERAEALAELLQAAREIEPLDLSTTRGEFLLRSVVAVATWMVACLSGEDDRNCVAMAGFCSGAPPSEPWPGPTPSSQILWYQLAAIEKKLRIDLGIGPCTHERTQGAHIEPFEVIRVYDDLEAAIHNGDAVSFATSLDEYARVRQYVEAEPKRALDVLTTVLVEPPWARIRTNITSNAVRDEVIAALVAFAAHHLLSSAKDERGNLGQALASHTGLYPLITALQGFDTPLPTSLGPGSEMAAFTLLATDDPLDPTELFAATCCVWRWLYANRRFEQSVAPALSKRLVTHWRQVVELAPFRLRAPLRTGPPILEASMRIHNVATLAAFILVAQDAVPDMLAQDARAALAHCAGGRRASAA
jgi:hypothetical protein